MTRGYEPGRAITPRVSPSPQPLAFLAFAGKLGAGANSWERNRTINWKRDVCYLTPSFLAGGACQPATPPRHPSLVSFDPSSSSRATRYALARRGASLPHSNVAAPRRPTRRSWIFREEIAVSWRESGFSLPVFGSLSSLAGEKLAVYKSAFN